MCHSLVMNYGLYKKMEIFVSDVFPTTVLRGFLTFLSGYVHFVVTTGLLLLFATFTSCYFSSYYK